jgi:nitrogen fixation/metabolism regulation signal transduction histidine kinase
MNKYEYIGELEYLSAYTDFYNGDYLQIGYIAVPQYFSKDQVQLEIQEFMAVIVHIYLVITLLFILLSLIINKQLSAPLTMLENSLKDIRLGQRNKKIVYKPNDEIGQLVIQYNKMVEELEKSVRLLAKSERESAWKTMARQVAHEINNPLTPMKLTIQQLQRTKKLGDSRFDDYFEKSTATLIEQIENLSRIAGTFSNFARLPEAKPQKVDVAKIVTMEVGLFVHNHDRIEITYQGVENGVFVLADREQLIQVFNNLLKNAIQSIPSDRAGKIEVGLDTSIDEVHVHIRDNGKGIADDIKDKLFTPNFTTKSTGMGLGLSISQNMVRIAGGEITFETEMDKGTVFHVQLPRVVEDV